MAALGVLTYRLVPRDERDDEMRGRVCVGRLDQRARRIIPAEGSVGPISLFYKRDTMRSAAQRSAASNNSRRFSVGFGWILGMGRVWAYHLNCIWYITPACHAIERHR
jgi:hypothetical protein